MLAEQISPQLVIQKVMTNLDVISSGEIDSSSATILDSPSMQSFIDNCSTIYDCIIEVQFNGSNNELTFHQTLSDF